MITMYISIVLIVISLFMFFYEPLYKNGKFMFFYKPLYKNGNSVFIAFIILMIGFLLPVIQYDYYIAIEVDKSAHEYCISQGYDTFESWKGKGFFPEHYDYVKCKFVDNRRDIQGNIEIKGD